MSRDKQIEEINYLTTTLWEANHKKSVLDYHWLATEVYNAGYRKASEVAREIFEEMQKRFKELYEEGKMAPFQCLVKAFNETEKKYTEDGE